MMYPEQNTRPIYDTDLSKPPAELIQKIRNNLSELRGQLRDIRYAYPAWKDRIECLEGGFTCMLIATHNIQEEFAKCQKKWGWTATPTEEECPIKL